MPYYITKAHPNPVGKDKAAHQKPTNEKLNQEWVEFTNMSAESVNLEGTTLHDRTYDHRCVYQHERQLIAFTGNMLVGQSIRLHTGSGTAFTEGTIRHIFLNEENYVWNNACGDAIIIRRNAQVNDWAEYAPHPSEGVVLNRIPKTNKFA